VMDHRLSPQDPLAPRTERAPDPAIELLLSEAPVALSAAIAVA
jgi:hypothetical protein